MGDLIREIEQRLLNAGFIFEDAANEAYTIGYAHGKNQSIKLPITEIYGDPDLAGFYSQGWDDVEGDKHLATILEREALIDDIKIHMQDLKTVIKRNKELIESVQNETVDGVTDRI